MIHCLAVISDVHGNRLALEAVLEDIRARSVDQIVNLGDCVYGPLDPAGTAELLIDLNIPTVSGNEDRILVQPPDDAACASSLDYTLDRLTARHLAWLASLKSTLIAFDDFLLCHGTPVRDDRYLLVDVESTGVVVRSGENIQKVLGERNSRFILCGHDHTPRVVPLPDGRLVVNPGSVGLPAYTDDHPYPHAMQTGSPHARYCILTTTNEGWRAKSIKVEYDWDAAADTAAANGRPDWAHWLRTGTGR